MGCKQLYSKNGVIEKEHKLRKLKKKNRCERIERRRRAGRKVDSSLCQWILQHLISWGCCHVPWSANFLPPSISSIVLPCIQLLLFLCLVIFCFNVLPVTPTNTLPQFHAILYTTPLVLTGSTGESRLKNCPDLHIFDSSFHIFT